MLAAGFGAFFAKKLNWLYFLVAATLVVYMAIAIPSFYLSPEIRADYDVQGKMRQVQTAVETWEDEHGKFPATDAELAQAITLAKVRLDDSPFQRAGHPVPYQVKLAANAVKPVSAAEQPATIYVAIDTTATHYWMSASTLPKPVADYAIPVPESRFNPQFVITGEAEPPSPAVTPAKAKMETKK